MDIKGRIHWLNQIENTNLISSLKIKALHVGVAPVKYDASGKQQQTIQENLAW